MSTYPPPSTLRTHVNPNGHLESLADGYDHNLPQYPFPYQNPSFLYRQGQTNGTPLVPQTHSNTHSYRSNAEGVMTPASGNEVSGAPYPHYGRQIQYNAFPTPEYPLMPFAHGMPPHGVQAFSQPYTESNPPLNSNSFFSNPCPAAEVHSANIRDPDTVPPPVSSELEDGELDDDEVGKATDRSRANTMTPLRISQHKRLENVDTTDSESSHRATNTSSKPLPGLNQGRFLPPRTLLTCADSYSKLFRSRFACYT